MSHTTTDREFKHYRPVPTDYGHDIEVYESSAANRPMLWMRIRLEAGNPRSNIEPEQATAHLSLHQARDVIETLIEAMVNHYQLGDPAPIGIREADDSLTRWAKLLVMIVEISEERAAPPAQVFAQLVPAIKMLRLALERKQAIEDTIRDEASR